MQGSHWRNEAVVTDYLQRTIPYRDAAEELLLEALPADARRILDLGTGAGRMIELVRQRAGGAAIVGLDFSQPMLDRACARFAEERRVDFVLHDMAKPLRIRGQFDVVVSALAIHHLEDARKRALFTEVRALLRSGGVFLNLDLVASPIAEEHVRFRHEIGRAEDDPSDRLADLCDQLGWLRTAGFEDCDCAFKWRELGIARRDGSMI